MRSTRPRPRSRDEAQHVGAIGEQPVETVGGKSHRHGVEAPPALIALEHARCSRIEPEPRRIDDHFGESGHVLEPHVEALPGDRMNDVRGIADQRDAVGDEGTRDEEAERMHAAFADDADLAEMQLEALFELGMKRIVWQRDDAFRLARRLGPHDRRASSFQRQDRKGSGGEKMLLGPALMIALVGDIDDNGGLAVIPAMGGDAGAGADGGAGAIGSGQKPRRGSAPVLERDNDPAAVMADLGGGGRLQDHAYVFGLLRQGRNQKPVLDHVGERLARFDVARESKEDRPQRIIETAVGHDHVEDRLRLPGDAAPNAERLEQPPRSGDDCRSALVGGVAFAERRIRHHDREGRPEPLFQRNGEREPGKTAARNQDIDIVTCHGATLARLIRPGLTPPVIPYARK